MPVLNYRDPVSGNWIPLGTGGGGSGNVATDVIWDTKGDLAVATGPDAAVKLPAGTNGQVLTADSTVTPTGLKWAAAGASLTALNQALLATKIWSSTQYVWPNGTAPDTNAYTNIIFIDPTGLHDPKTSTGGRNNANDLWETGTPTGGGGGGTTTTDKGLWAASTAYNPGDVVTYGGCHFQRLATGFTSGTLFDPSNWLAMDRLDVDNPATWSAANAADYEFDATTTSVPSGWAWTNQGTATYAEGQGAGVIHAPALSGDNWRIIDRAFPVAGTWLATFKVTTAARIANYNSAGIVLRESSSGKFYVVNVSASSSGTMQLGLFTNPTTFVSNSFTTNNVAYSTIVYFRVRRNSSTSYDIDWSIDGLTWASFAGGFNPTANLTPDRIGFACEPNNASNDVSVGCHWFRVR